MSDEVRFDPETGLAPAVVQSTRDGRVLMLAYMNREALRRTLEDGRVTFWSRSRSELWRKGETSGNWLETVEVRPDCDGDALLVRAREHGPACHTGSRSCFDPDRREEVPGPALGPSLESLVDVVARRDRRRPEGSYTVGLLDSGVRAPARKVAEEAIEVLTAALEEGEERLAEESADLLYHLAVLWRAAGLDPSRVAAVLDRRRRPRPGLDGQGPGAAGRATPPGEAT